MVRLPDIAVLELQVYQLATVLMLAMMDDPAMLAMWFS
jgi:hypothetical protein